MIPNQWYAILESNEVPRGKPVGVTRMGEKLVAWRDSQGQVTVMRDLCPHRGVALSAGKLPGDCIVCPFHGFQYDTSGRCTLIPANGRSSPVPKAFQVQAYPTHEAHGFIFIWWGQPGRSCRRPVSSTTSTKLQLRLGPRSLARPLLAPHREPARRAPRAVHPPQHHRPRAGHGDGWPVVEWQDPDRLRSSCCPRGRRHAAAEA